MAIARRVWERAVGSRISERAQPLKLVDEVLTVRVTNTSWANELSLLSEDIRAQLTSAGVRVKALRFVVGKLDHRHARRRAQPARPAPPKGIRPPAKVRRLTAAVPHDPLRQAVDHAAGAALWLSKHHNSQPDR